MPAEPQSRVGMSQRARADRPESALRADPSIPQMFTVHGTGATPLDVAPGF